MKNGFVLSNVNLTKDADQKSIEQQVVLKSTKNKGSQVPCITANSGRLQLQWRSIDASTLDREFQT
jgi:hypothetical protein